MIVDEKEIFLKLSFRTRSTKDSMCTKFSPNSLYASYIFFVHRLTINWVFLMQQCRLLRLFLHWHYRVLFWCNEIATFMQESAKFEPLHEIMRYLCISLDNEIIDGLSTLRPCHTIAYERNV